MKTVPQELISKIRDAKSIVFFTGAGISAESGIPTFRGENGIWKKMKPEELASFDAFLDNPQLVWEWYNHRREILSNTQPNAGHTTITEFQRLFPKVTVITQNVDNLHKRAGNLDVYELHGNIERNYCIKCGKPYTEPFELNNKVLKCECGGLIRPDVVWFGENLPEDQFSAAEKASSQCDIFFIVGTSGVVFPAASLIYVAKDKGAYLVEINIEETDITSMADISFFGKSGEILPYILEAVKASN